MRPYIIARKKRQFNPETSLEPSLNAISGSLFLLATLKHEYGKTRERGVRLKKNMLVFVAVMKRTITHLERELPPMPRWCFFPWRTFPVLAVGFSYWAIPTAFIGLLLILSINTWNCLSVILELCHLTCIFSLFAHRNKNLSAPYLSNLGNFENSSFALVC